MFVTRVDLARRELGLAIHELVTRGGKHKPQGDGHADELYRTLLPRRHADPGKQAVAALMRSFIDTLNAKHRPGAPHR